MFEFIFLWKLRHTVKILSTEMSIKPVADLRGEREGRASQPRSPNSFNFMQFLENLAKSYVGAAPWGVGAPSSGKSWIRHCKQLFCDKFHIQHYTVF